MNSLQRLDFFEDIARLGAFDEDRAGHHMRTVFVEVAWRALVIGGHRDGVLQHIAFADALGPPEVLDGIAAWSSRMPSCETVSTVTVCPDRICMTGVACTVGT